ncbi:MAG: hypothetical protein ACT4PL_04425, partial [Phycisphaerales bacterium]
MPVQATRGSARLISGAFTGMTGVLGGAFVLGLASAMTLAQTAGSTTAVDASRSGTVAGSGLVDQARAALDAGRLVESQSILRRVVGGADARFIASAEMTAALELLDRADRRLRIADPIEVSVQKAELLATEGDLRLAETHLSAARKTGRMTPVQSERAQQVEKDIASVRETLRPMVADALTRSTVAFDGGRYGDAKATLGVLTRSGVALSAEQREVVETQQMRLVELEREQGKAFTAGTALGLLQPGTVRRSPAPATTPVAGSVPAQPTTTPAPAATDPNTSTGSTLVIDATGNAPAATPAAPVAPVAQAPASEQAAQPAGGTPPGATPPAAAPVAESAPATMVVTAQPADDLMTLAMKAEMQRLVAEADQAFGEGRYSDAIRKYRQALTSGRAYLTAEEAKGAENKLAEAEVRMKGSGSLSETVGTQFDLIRQQTTAEFNNSVAQAEKALETGEISRARELAATAGVTADRARPYFSQTEQDAFAARRAELNAKITKSEDALRAKDEASRKDQLEREAKEKKSNVAAEKDRRVREALTRVRALQMEKKYEEALQVTEQVLFMDPNNPGALVLKEFLNDILVFERYDRLDNRKDRNMQTFRLQNKDAYIPPTGLMNYPENWPT